MVLYENGPWKILSHEELRWKDDSSELDLFMLSAGVSRDFGDHTALALHYTYYECENTVPGDPDCPSKTIQEIDPELHNWFMAADWLKISFRQRLEIRWIEDAPEEPYERSRHRLQLTFPIKDLGPVTAFYANEEFFYDWDKGLINENRLIPFGVDFKISDKTGISLFYMLQSTDTIVAWDHNHILGTQFKLHF